MNAVGRAGLGPATPDASCAEGKLAQVVVGVSISVDVRDKERDPRVQVGRHHLFGAMRRSALAGPHDPLA